MLQHYFNFNFNLDQIAGYGWETQSQDCPGNNLKSSTITYEACAQECDTTADCVGFVYYFWAENEDSCHLKGAGFCQQTRDRIDAFAFRKGRLQVQYSGKGHKIKYFAHIFVTFTKICSQCLN